MRLALALLVVTATPAFADDHRALTATEIRAQLRPVGDAVEHCYLDRTTDVRGAGHLEIVLDVSRYGIVEHVGVNTPGLGAKLAKDIADCVRTAVAPISFPVRRAPTLATVPYYFQRTDAPNAGPQLSCWDPHGCHTK